MPPTANFPPAEDRGYRFVGFTSRGFPINTTAQVEERRVSWSTQVPHLGEVEYKIWIDEEGNWIQTGEVIDKGQKRRFLELKLQRVEPTQSEIR